MVTTDKSISLFTPVTDILDTDFIIAGRPSTSPKQDISYTGAVLKSKLGKPNPIPNNCAPGTTTSIPLGSILTVNHLLLNCVFVRGESRMRQQQIAVFQINGLVGINPGAMATIPTTDTETTGIVSITATEESGQIMLNITTDNSDASTTILTYTVLDNG